MKVVTTGEADQGAKQEMTANLSKDNKFQSNPIPGAGGQSSRTRYQAMLTGQLPQHQHKEDRNGVSTVEAIMMEIGPEVDRNLPGTTDGRVSALRNIFEPGVLKEGCSILHEMQVDSLEQKEANVVGQRKIAKAGRGSVPGRKGLVQARIDSFMNLSENYVAKKGRLPKRKRGKVGDNKMDSTKKKQKK